MEGAWLEAHARGTRVEAKGRDRDCNPYLLQCEIKDSRDNKTTSIGVWVHDHTMGVFTECNIHSNRWSNVQFKSRTMAIHNSMAARSETARMVVGCMYLTRCMYLISFTDLWNECKHLFEDLDIGIELFLLRLLLRLLDLGTGIETPTDQDQRHQRSTKARDGLHTINTS